MTLVSSLPWILLAAFAIAFFVKPRKSSEEPQDSRLTAELAEVKSERDKLIGQGKQLYAENVQLKAEYKSLGREQETLTKKLATLEAKEERREKELQENLSKLQAAERSLEDERMRVRREDEAKRQQEEEERDRIWNEHEQSVIALLTDLCKSPELGFMSYSNTNLPDAFDGSLKPDFMIELLGQYIIFDAKASKAKSLQIYINDTVKKTVQKVKENDKIAKTIFLVVPTRAISELKTHRVFFEGYTFYVVSPEALAPVLASLKRIAAYEFAEKLDPQERENIVHLIAKFDTHINLRNTFDVLMAKMGSEVLRDAERVDPELREEIAQEKAKIRLPSFKTSDVKKLMNGDVRREELQGLTRPKAAVKIQDVESMQGVLVEE